MDTTPKQMTKKDLVQHLVELNQLSKVAAECIVNHVFCLIEQSLLDGQTVVLPGIGQLKPATASARTGRNPQTMEQFQIPEKRTVKLRLSAPFKRRLG